MNTKPNPLFTKVDTSSREASADFRVLQTVVLVSLAGALGTVAATYVFDATQQARFIVISLTILLAFSFVLLRRRIFFPARILAPLSLYVTITFLMITGSGIHDISIIAYGGVIIIASLTLGRRAAFVSASLIIAAIFAISLAEINGSLVTDASGLTTIDDPFLISIVVASITFTQIVLINRMNASLMDARENAQAQTESNSELIELKNSLEARVQARTADLEQANLLNERRASQFESIAQLARSATSLDEFSSLLPHIARQIGVFLKYERVSIYLLDEGASSGSLAAIFDQSGQELSATPLAAESLAGIVAFSGLSRTAFNEGDDAHHFSAPEFSSINSEIALPLIAGSRIIGVLDVHSKNIRAFAVEDVSTLSILADVVSNAIEGSRQYHLSRKSLAETASAYSESLGQDWNRFVREENLGGFRFVAGVSEPIAAPLIKDNLSILADSTQVEKVNHRDGLKTRMRVPVRVRGRALGSLDIFMPEDHPWSEDDIDIVETVAERLALSLENARLFQASAGRAERERIVSEITSKISGSVRMESILRTAAQELSQALSGSEVLIQLKAGNPNGGPR